MTNGFESTDWTQNVTRLSGAAAAFSEDLLLNLRTERNGDIADLQILNIQHERKKNAIQALTEVLAQISGLRNYSDVYKNLFNQLFEVFTPRLQQMSENGQSDLGILLQKLIDNPEIHRREVKALFREYSLFFQPIAHVRDIQDNLANLYNELLGMLQEDPETGLQVQETVDDICDNIDMFLDKFIDWQAFEQEIVDRELEGQSN